MNFAMHIGQCKYSNKAFILDTKTCVLTQKPRMKEMRQAHGMCLIGQYVYCCAGLDGYNILKSCERFDLKNEVWTSDVPDMKLEKFSMTMMRLDQTWLYSFGGASIHFRDDLKDFEIERIDTSKLDQWERIVIKCDMKSCCQQGVIPLNTSWGNDQIGQKGERRFLIFGGVHGDYTKQTFIFNQNLSDITKSYCTEKQNLPFGDKFYFQQMFRITELPEEIKHVVKQKKLKKD